jgi:hypothetical protein
MSLPLLLLLLLLLLLRSSGKATHWSKYPCATRVPNTMP